MGDLGSPLLERFSFSERDLPPMPNSPESLEQTPPRILQPALRAGRFSTSPVPYGQGLMEEEVYSEDGENVDDRDDDDDDLGEILGATINVTGRSRRRSKHSLSLTPKGRGEEGEDEEERTSPLHYSSKKLSQKQTKKAINPFKSVSDLPGLPPGFKAEQEAKEARREERREERLKETQRAIGQANDLVSKAVAGFKNGRRVGGGGKGGGGGRKAYSPRAGFRAAGGAGGAKAMATAKATPGLRQRYQSPRKKEEKTDSPFKNVLGDEDDELGEI